MSIGDRKQQERWKRLEALGAKGEDPTPEDEAKMSAVIVELAKPLIAQRGNTPQRAKSIIGLTIAAWNKSMFPPEKQSAMEKELIDAFVPKNGSAEAVAAAMEVMDIVAERGKRLFPDVHKMIVDYEIEFGEGRLKLDVSSVPVSDFGSMQIQKETQAGLSGRPHQNAAVPNAEDRAAIVSRYQRLRSVGIKLNHKLVKRISKAALDEGGKKLGILQRGVLVFNSEDESSVLMDYCLYDVRQKGRNAIEQYLLDSTPAPDSDEMAYLRAMQQAIYSLFVVKSVLRGLGVIVRDLLSDETILIADMGFGSSAQPGLIFASRVLFCDDFAMTGGAALPISVAPEDQLEEITRQFSQAAQMDADSRFDPAPIIRSCLRQGCSSHVQYQEPSGKPVGPHRSSGRVRSSKQPRNAPCPCGSGKKFKNCCLKNP